MNATANALILICSTSAAMADPAGLRLQDLEMPHHGKQASATIWHPNGGGGEVAVFAENPVFHGVNASMDASLVEGQHPVILFSHGMGGTTRAQAWLASALAQRGAIVVSVNHANSTWGDFDMRDGIKHWTRVADLSTALDALLANPEYADHIDHSRIMAAGFSYGGWTALSMGGVTGNLLGIVDACTTYIDTMETCDMLLSERVNMQGINPSVWNADYSDQRITHVTAIDPGFVWGLSVDNVAGLVADVHLIGFGGPQDRMQATDFDASGLSAMLPDAQITRFDPSFHFTAMPLCKPAGAAILLEENDDPVCTDPVGTERAIVHASIVEVIANDLGL